MDPVVSLLTCVALGSATLMMGMLICRETEKNFSCAIKECLAWGTGFFIAMSIQVIAIANL